MNTSTRTENHKQRKNVATDKKCILWKINMNFPNPKFNLLFIITYILIQNKNPLELRGQWSHSVAYKISWIRLYALIFKIIKLCTNLVPRK